MGKNVDYPIGTVPGSCYQISSPGAGFSPNTLPDPFKFLDGKAVKSKEDWACRREQIRALFQKYEQGDKPPKPQILNGTLSDGSLSITAGNAGKSIQFSVPIKMPGGKGVPAIITIQNQTTIPIPAGIAVLNLPVDIIAFHTARNKGVFYDLYGQNATASTLMAWAWATSRIIDLIEEHPEWGIDATKIGVTGCSRYGKGALVTGAFDDRIALVIAQESGTGGDGCWRVVESLKASGKNVEVTSNIAGTSWTAKSFGPFSGSQESIGRLPIDHHELAGLIAPRGLFTTESDAIWFGLSSGFQCMTAAHTIYEALGFPDNHGFSQVGGPAHCTLPSAQTSEINAFIDKFLLGKPANTNIFTNTLGYKSESKWMPWNIPRLV